MFFVLRVLVQYPGANDLNTGQGWNDWKRNTLPHIELWLILFCTVWCSQIHSMVEVICQQVSSDVFVTTRFSRFEATLDKNCNDINETQFVLLCVLIQMGLGATTYVDFEQKLFVLHHMKRKALGQSWVKINQPINRSNEILKWNTKHKVYVFPFSRRKAARSALNISSVSIHLHFFLTVASQPTLQPSQCNGSGLLQPGQDAPFEPTGKMPVVLARPCSPSLQPCSTTTFS